MEEERFDVEIWEYATGKTEAVIGSNLTAEKAERREMTGLRRCNSDFGTRIVPHKSDKCLDV